MEGDVLPALRRLNDALVEAHRVTLDIASLMRSAEEEAAALFAITAEKGFWGHVGDFFSGMGAELWDMVEGIGTLISDPRGAVEGLIYAINNPRVLLDAIVQPYVEDWNNGRPWRAIGRGVMAILTTIIGTKGIDKALKLSRGAGAARVATAATWAARARSLGRMPIDDALKLITRSSDDAMRLADEAARVANAGGDISTLADDIARQSTHYFETPTGSVPDRVVLGRWDEGGVKGYYIRQAHPDAGDGGIFYATGNEVWETLDTTITDPAMRRQVLWDVNRSFLRQQLDAGIPRIEYVSPDFRDILTRYAGQSYDDVLADWVATGRRSTDGTRIRYGDLEVLYLRDNALANGYDLVGNTWVRKP